ncbi:FAD-dependent thymidylate synthase [Candidatus Woesearchaeota archaeon]|nr:FAD-dependent thymidylate synthase [Candidatus Woesearchaeota archaeon]
MGIYETTGTLAPLVNERPYTDDERIVLLHFFTNVDRNVYCTTDALSSQLWAFLVGQYSRSPKSMRDRFLQLFSDAESALSKGKISKDSFVSLKELALAIKSGQFRTIEYFNTRAADFLKKWGVDYGHNSLKDADKIRIAVEGVSQVFTKVIEAPFPALGDFQEKSTRYIEFSKESCVESPALASSAYAEQVKVVTDELMDVYVRYLPEVKAALVANNIISKGDFERESAFIRTLDAKAFDVMRYVLPTSVSTCLGASFSARTLESHLSEMLSHPLAEVRMVATTIHKEALKVSPGLLKHVAENPYLEQKIEAVQPLVDEMFQNAKMDPIIRGISNDARVTLLEAKAIDDKVCASILYERSRAKGLSFAECMSRTKLLPEKEKAKIIDAELGGRGRFDRMPRSVQHGSIMFEFFFDFGAYRDVQRHRASTQIWQGATAIHGYEYPEYIDLPGMEQFKKAYDGAMTKATELARKMIDDDPYESEYVCALGHLIRTTFEMHPGQLAYVTELRTTPQGHQSYRRLFQRVHALISEAAPIFAKHIRVNADAEASRKKQEEVAAKKREELGL